MKRCCVCKVELPLSAFGRYRRQKDGLNTRCRRCANEERRRYVAANRDTVNEAQARSYAKRRALAANLLESQGGLCAVCHAPDPTDLDHDHACCDKGCEKCWRGWLCKTCNRLLVAAADHPLIHLAIEYVERTRKVYG